MLRNLVGKRFCVTQSSRLSRRRWSRSYTTRIGIDFGTTNTCLAIMEGDVPRVIETLEGDRLSASVVTYHEDGTWEVGAPAKRQAISNAANTFWATKRLIGKSFDDPAVKELKEYVPYKIVKGPSGDAQLEDSWGRKRTPVEIAAAIIQKMKENAESHLGTSVEGAIVSTPGYFTEKQKKALTDAVEKAGLPLLSLIPEHIAAAIGHTLPIGQDQKILVYHFGGGTFDASVLDFTDSEYTVKSSVTDFSLGGQVFDQRIIDMLLTDFQKEHNMDLRTDAAAMQRVRDACERARTELSTSLRAAITLNYIAADEKGPKHINVTLTRAKAEELFEDLISKSIELTQKALEQAGITADKIGTVLAVGGVCKMPRVREALTAAMGKEPIRPINPDEAVAIGAAILAGKKSMAAGGAKGTLANFIPLSVGVETAGGIFVPIIPAGTPVPCEKKITLSTNSDAQQQVTVKLFQGERLFAADNLPICEVTLKDIPMMPRSFPQVEIKINVDFTGYLTAIVREKISDVSTFVRKGFGGPGRWGGHTQKQVNQILRTVEMNHDADKAKKAKVEAVLLGRHTLHHVSRELISLKDQLSAAEAEEIKAKVKALKEAMTMKNATADQIQQAIGELDSASRDPFAKAIVERRKAAAAATAEQNS